jgi:hypothetical protein
MTAAKLLVYAAWLCALAAAVTGGRSRDVAGAAAVLCGVFLLASLALGLAGQLSSPRPRTFGGIGGFAALAIGIGVALILVPQ